MKKTNNLVRNSAVGLSIVAISTACFYAYKGYSESPNEAAIRENLATVLPGVEVHGIDCDQPGDLCEVLADGEILYTDKSGEYAFAGNILSLKDRVDLTEQRRAGLSLFTNALTGVQPETVRPARAVQDRPVARPMNVEVTLPVENAIVYNGGQGLPVINVFSDLNCGFCQRLHAEVEMIEGYEIREYLVEWLGASSRSRANIVLCAEDRTAAARDMYTTGSASIVTSVEDCNVFNSVITENTNFARQFGMQGTPTIIMGDGRRFPGGYAPASEILAFAEEQI